MWFNQPPHRRILSWREWRNSLENKPIDYIANEIAVSWARVPTVMHFLSPDNSDQWPNPWQLIADNYYCDLGVCLGMFYTLALLESPNIENLEINIYRNTNGWVNLSSIDHGKYVLNYNHGRVVNNEYVFKDQAELVFSYSKLDLLNKFS